MIMWRTDTHLVCYFDVILGKYVAYFRDYMIHRQRELPVAPSRFGN